MKKHLFTPLLILCVAQTLWIYHCESMLKDKSATIFFGNDAEARRPTPKEESDYPKWKVAPIDPPRPVQSLTPEIIPAIKDNPLDKPQNEDNLYLDANVNEFESAAILFGQNVPKKSRKIKR